MSEAGTYTIDKDSSPELDRGRGDIERVFGEAAAYGGAEVHNNAHWDGAPVSENYKVRNV